jgi:hypothetical protein
MSMKNINDIRNRTRNLLACSAMPQPIAPPRAPIQWLPVAIRGGKVFGITLRSETATHHVTRHNTPIHNILSTAAQLSISQKALGTLPEDGNVMPKHVGATIHN